jgi:hypothetical protein
MEALARYRFLTITQLVRLGAGEEKGVRTRLQDLLTAKLIDRQESRLGPSAGRLPNVHWLTTKGARFLSEATGETVVAPLPRALTPMHLWHRMLTIDTLIACDAWAERSGQERPVITSYMQRQGRNAQSEIGLMGKTAIADAIVRAVDGDGNGRVYVLEIYCSHYSDGRSIKPVTQLEPYVLTGMGNVLDEALGIPANGKAARVLVVCDSTELRDRLLRQLPDREGMPPLDHRAWARFHFKSADELSDFGDGWHTVGGQHVSLPR